MNRLDRIRDVTHRVGTSQHHDQDAWMSDQMAEITAHATVMHRDLQAEREKVRLLRYALENLVDRDLVKGDPCLDDCFEEVGDALATTSPGGQR